jgi:hypothetical protein
MIIAADLRCVASDLRNVVQHRSIGIRERRPGVVVLERLDQFFIEGDATQKLCVRLDSIMTAIQDRDDRRDHLVLLAGERKVWGHQYAKG